MRTRRTLLLVLIPSLGPLLLAAGVLAANIGYLGWPCIAPPETTGFGSEVVGMATRSQNALQHRLLINRFAKDCRPDAQGLIDLVGESEEAVIRAMLLREDDALERRYVLYGLDRPLTSAEKQQIEQDLSGQLLRVSPIVQIPVWVEGIAVATNVPCTQAPLKLSSVALSNIFSGVATAWNDPSITVTNPVLETCAETIRVAVRSDISPQTTVFKEYLSKRNPSWSTYLQPNLNRQWPPTMLDPCRGRGDAGVAACVAGHPGSIGYVGFAEAFRRGLQTALVENRSDYVAPSYQACTQAAEVGMYPARSDLDWAGVSLTDPPVGYAICKLSFGLAFEKMSTAYGGLVTISQVRTVKDFFATALSDKTQARLVRYGYSKLPALLLRIARDGAESIGYFE